MPRDPEATADLVDDLRLRASPRHREPRNPFAVTIVAHWKCRGGCGELIGVGADDVERLEISNRRARQLGQEPIASDKVVWCKPCRERDLELARLARPPARTPQQLDLGATGETRSTGMRTAFTKPRRMIR